MNNNKEIIFMLNLFFSASVFTTEDSANNLMIDGINFQLHGEMCKNPNQRLVLEKLTGQKTDKSAGPDGLHSRI